MRQSKTLLTIKELGSEIATFRLPTVASRATNGNKTQFLTIIGLRSLIILTFSIATNPVWIRSTLHYVMVDISAYNWIKSFGTACAWKEGI